MKYEDPFDLTNEKKKYIFPFHLPEDVYEITEESKIR